MDICNEKMRQLGALGLPQIRSSVLVILFFFPMLGFSEELELKVIRPVPGEALSIRQGGTFVIGTVSPPQATLTVNGAQADVSDDGAFIAFAPIQTLAKPVSIRLAGGPRKKVDAAFDFVARAGDRKLDCQVLVSLPAVEKKKESPVEDWKPVAYRVRTEQVLSQTATTNWGLLYLPQNAFVWVTGRQGTRLRVQAGLGQQTWIERSELEPLKQIPAVTNIAVITVSAQTTRFEVGAILPFAIEQKLSPPQLSVTLFCPDSIRAFPVPCPTQPPWGFAATYATNTLVVTQRIPRAPRHGLQGKIVCLDPGHNPDSGAIGPRGFQEREANLKIGLALERLLTAAGAKVVFTHRSEPLPLLQRRAAVLRYDPDIFLSLHNNSIPDGTDPRIKYGTSTFYYHPQSKLLAETIHAALLSGLGFPDLKVQPKSLYVCRISECPAILVEPAFIILPDQERLLMNEPGQQKIAKAIFDGIQRFFVSQTTTSTR